MSKPATPSDEEKKVVDEDNSNNKQREVGTPPPEDKLDYPPNDDIVEEEKTPETVNNKEAESTPEGEAEKPSTEEAAEENVAATTEEEKAPQQADEEGKITPPADKEEVQLTPVDEAIEQANNTIGLPPNEDATVEVKNQDSDVDQEETPFSSSPPAPAPAAAAETTEKQTTKSKLVSSSDDDDNNNNNKRENDEEFQPSPSSQKNRSSRSHSVVSINDTSNLVDDNESDLMAHSSSSRGRMNRRASSFMGDTRSSSAKRSNTPHPRDKDDKKKKPAWRPSSKVPNLIKDARKQAEDPNATDPNRPDFVKNNATFNALANNLMGVDGRTTLAPIKQTYATNLFQQLHIAIHGRSAIGVKKKDGSRGAMYKKAVGIRGGINPGDLPYSLVPPAAQNSANNLQIPAALLMPSVSTMNTSLTANTTARARGNKAAATSVLSLLCLTGNAESDTNPSVSTCLRMIPCQTDHRSIAVERVVPALPREGARFVGTFLGEDSTFLSRQFLTYDGIAAFEEDWQVLGDLVAGDFLSASLTQGVTRSGVVLFQSGPESEAVTNAFCDGSQPFLNRMSEVLIQACHRNNQGQQEQQQKDDDEEETQKQADDMNNNNGEEAFKSSNPLMHSATANILAEKRKREKREATRRGPTAAAAALSQLNSTKKKASSPHSSTYSGEPHFSKSVKDALADTTSGGRGNNNNSSRNNNKPNPAAGVEFTTIESLIEAYSFDYVAVSGLDINPGALTYDRDAICDDEITDVLSQNNILLTQRHRHVPFKHHAVPVWCLPSDELPGHQFHNGKGKFRVTTPQSKLVSGASSPSASNINSKRKTSFVDDEDSNNNSQALSGNLNDAPDLETYNSQIVSNEEDKVVNKGAIQSIECRTAEEISEAVAKLMKTKSNAPGCHRIVSFTLRKNKKRPPSPPPGDSPRKTSTISSNSDSPNSSPGGKKKKKRNSRKSSTIVEPKHLTINNQQQNSEFALTYEPKIMFVFLSSNMRKGKSALGSTHSKEPHIHRAISRDHKELFQCLEHVSKYDGMGKEQCMLQPFEFEGALTNILSTYAWLRPDCCKTVYLATAKAFSESPDETNNVLMDLDRVKRYPIHPRAHTTFVSQGLPPIELPPLVAKQAAHILGKNIVASSPRHQQPNLKSSSGGTKSPLALSPSPPKQARNLNADSPRMLKERKEREAAERSRAKEQYA